MADGDGRIYFVLTLRGDRGPFDRAGLAQCVAAGEARQEDQVRNAFGRPLGTVGEVLAANRSTATRAGQTPLRAATASGRHQPRSESSASARSSAAQRPSRKRGLPIGVLVALAVAALLAVVGLAASLLTQPAAAATPPTPAGAPPTAVPRPPPAVPATPPPTAAVLQPYQPTGNEVAVELAYGRAVASSQNIGSEGLIQAFDGDPGSKWLAFLDRRPAGEPRSGWIRIEPTGPRRRIVGYALTSANDYEDRDPISWRLIGIATDGTETELDRRTDERWEQRCQRREFPLVRIAEQAAFRFDFLTLRGGDLLPNSIQLGEVELLPAIGATAR